MDNLVLLLLVPIIGAVLLAFIKNTNLAKPIALICSLIALGITGTLLGAFVPDASMQFEQNIPWIPALGIHFHVGIDGISMPLVLLTNGLIPLIILSTFKQQQRGAFYALVLFM